MPNYVSFVERAGQSGSVDSAFQRNYQKDFIVTVDDPLASPWFVGSHPQLPKIFDRYPDDLKAYCVSITPKQRAESPLVWDVSTVWTYSPDTYTPGVFPTGNPSIDQQQTGKPPAERQQLPLVRGNDYTYSVQRVRDETVYSDAVTTTKEIENSAGDSFPNPPTRPVCALRITVGTNLPGAPDSSWDRLCSGTLNEQDITIGTRTFPARTVSLESYSATLVYEEEVSYWRWTLNFLYMPADDWKWKPRSTGVMGWMKQRGADGVERSVKAPFSVACPGADSGNMDLDANGEWCAKSGLPSAKLEFNLFKSAPYPVLI